MKVRGWFFEMEEIWKPIEGYEGKYEISTRGRVKSLARMIMRCDGRALPLSERILKPGVNVSGKYFKNIYRYVFLSGDEGTRCEYVHVLVAKAFIPNPENKPCVDHIHGSQMGDMVENLRWCTHFENSHFDLAHSHRCYAMSGGRHPRYGKFGSDNPTSKAVEQYTKNGEYIKTFGSTMDAQRETGVANTNISACCLGKRKTTGGYIWKYVE